MKSKDEIKKLKISIYMSSYMKEYRKTEKFRNRMSRYMKEYRKTHKKPYKPLTSEARSRYYKKYMSNNPNVAINNKISRGIRYSIKNNKSKLFWENILGYTLKDLKLHLENKFNIGMNWDNYGSYWVIDHIVPRCNFKYDSIEDSLVKECWSINNLQPLERMNNILKGKQLI